MTSTESTPATDEVDLINRDPNGINDHIAVAFEDVLGEPDGVRSVDCVWRWSYKCFNLWKNLCYRISTLLCGICIAMSWGCEFAQIAMLHVWYITPLMKVLEINCGCSKKLYGLCINCCLDPLCESCGLIFRAFKRS
ncbi:caveolin-1-like [Liolophura sinensis]|uniref:caveolin-1-like n=1 Tax=Liolophura sinensis TaxID=3198878 RepID=UPI0031590FF7